MARRAAPVVVVDPVEQERTQRGIRRELSIQSVKRGHALNGRWRQVNTTSHTTCSTCGCMIAGDGEWMAPGVVSCADGVKARLR